MQSPNDRVKKILKTLTILTCRAKWFGWVQKVIKAGEGRETARRLGQEHAMPAYYNTHTKTHKENNNDFHNNP